MLLYVGVLILVAVLRYSYEELLDCWYHGFIFH